MTCCLGESLIYCNKGGYGALRNKTHVTEKRKDGRLLSCLVSSSANLLGDDHEPTSQEVSFIKPLISCAPLPKVLFVIAIIAFIIVTTKYRGEYLQLVQSHTACREKMSTRGTKAYVTDRTFPPNLAGWFFFLFVFTSLSANACPKKSFPN